MFEFNGLTAVLSEADYSCFDSLLTRLCRSPRRIMGVIQCVTITIVSNILKEVPESRL